MKQAILALSMIFILYCPFGQAFSNHSVFNSTSQCVKCHPRALPTHKKQAPKRMSEDWPLDNGSLTCLTCHKCTTGSCILRKSPPQLCQVCHDCTQGMACMIGSAHPGNSEDMQKFVSNCKFCHDGTLGPEIGSQMDHKIDVDYHPSRNFRILSDRRIVLVDGKVTCVSCHDPYKFAYEKLAMDNTSIKLCLTCHIK